MPNRLRSFLLACLALVLALALAQATALAQPRLGIHPDMAGEELTLDVFDFSPFSSYIVATGLDGGIAGWEASAILPHWFTILEENFLPAGAASSGQPANYIVDLGGCIPASASVALLELRGGFFAAGASAGEHLFCVSAAEPSRLDPPAPAYVDCSGNPASFRPAQGYQSGVLSYPNGCMVLNPDNCLECCFDPPEPVPGDLGFWPRDAEGAVGDVVQMAVDVRSVDAGGLCLVPKYPATISWIRAVMTWDAPFAELVEVTGLDLPEGWTVGATVSPGQVELELTGDPAYAYPETMTRVAQLGFRLLQPGGESPVVVQEVEAWDDEVGPIQVLFVSAELASSVVATAPTSFGVLKAAGP